MSILFNGKQINDPMVVSAFNSCLDMKKWQALPEAVRTRFRNLLQHNRIKMVCFSNESGVGLRVYNDDHDGKNIWDFDGGDQVEPYTAKGDHATVDLTGSWVECPGSHWEKFVGAATATLKFLVKDGLGIRYLRRFDDDEDEPDFDWSTLRTQALKFDKETAESIAQKVQGVVVKEK